jgi:hypothetical protein
VCFHVCNDSNLHGSYCLYVESSQSQGNIIFIFCLSSLPHIYFHPEETFFFIPYGAFARLETLGTVTGEVRKEAKT